MSIKFQHTPWPWVAARAAIAKATKASTPVVDEVAA